MERSEGVKERRGERNKGRNKEEAGNDKGEEGRERRHLS